jgi:hypothetical protein
MKSLSNEAVPVNGITPGLPAQPNTKTFIEECGDIIKVDETTFSECLIAHKRGVNFRWIKDIDNGPYKVILKDQDFNQ